LPPFVKNPKNKKHFMQIIAKNNHQQEQNKNMIENQCLIMELLQIQIKCL